MIKMLLVGEINFTLKSLNESLKDGFQVQICSQNAKNVKDMVRILRPGIIVMNIQEINDDVREIFETLKTKLDQMPILVIGSARIQEEIKMMLDGFKSFLILNRPIKTIEILNGCYRLLNLDVLETENKTETPQTIKKKIMVIDDNALVLRNIKSLLEADYEICLATSGKQGLETILKKAIDLILLDYDMPEMDGKEVFEIIKSDDSLKNIPVIFLTSVSEREHILAVLKFVPFGYILKPPARDKLFGIIKEALGE